MNIFSLKITIPKYASSVNALVHCGCIYHTAQIFHFFQNVPNLSASIGAQPESLVLSFKGIEKEGLLFLALNHFQLHWPKARELLSWCCVPRASVHSCVCP